MPGGRPPKNFDLEKAKKMAMIMCTQEEIAAVLDVSVRTLERSKQFCQVFKKGQETGKASLRRMQYKAAEEGNVTAQIWLGKQYLGQKDMSRQELTGRDGEKLTIQVVKIRGDSTDATS